MSYKPLPPPPPSPTEPPKPAHASKPSEWGTSNGRPLTPPPCLHPPRPPPQVRVVGGAYGGFCSFDPHSGNFAYLSYRDPNLMETLDAYDGSPAFLKALKLTPDELTKVHAGGRGRGGRCLIGSQHGCCEVRGACDGSLAAPQGVRAHTRQGACRGGVCGGGKAQGMHVPTGNQRMLWGGRCVRQLARGPQGAQAHAGRADRGVGWAAAGAPAAPAPWPSLFPTTPSLPCALRAAHHAHGPSNSSPSRPPRAALYACCSPCAAGHPPPRHPSPCRTWPS